MSRIGSKILYGPAFQAAQVEERAIRLPEPCTALSGRSLLFMSDVHLSNRFPRAAVEKLLAQAEALRADMLILGGDYAESAAWQREFFSMVGQLKFPLGAYAVLGNNDCECFPDGEGPLAESMRCAGVTLLTDGTVRLGSGGGRIAIAGMDEFRRAQRPAKPLFTKEDDGALRILTAHYPQSIAQYLDGEWIKPHLCLSGHTHGGQFRVMGMTPYSIGFEYRFKGVRLPAVSGWKEMGEAKLLVSPGLGTSRIPVRIGVEPTIHLIQFMM